MPINSFPVESGFLLLGFKRWRKILILEIIKGFFALLDKTESDFNFNGRFFAVSLRQALCGKIS